MTWLAALAFGLPRYVWLAIATSLVAAGALWLQKAERADDRANQNIGQLAERAQHAGETLERTEQGHAVRNAAEDQAARGSGVVLYEQCLRAQRGPAQVCERFLPQRSAAQR